MVSAETGTDLVFGIVGFFGLPGTMVSGGYFIVKGMGKGIHNEAIRGGASLDNYGFILYEDLFDF